MATEKKPDRSSSPWIAKVITFVLLALAIQSQLKTGHIDTSLQGTLVVLAFFWVGQSIDKYLPFR